MQILLEGFGLGLAVSFSFGPAFWAVIQTGIDRGFKWGLLLSLGVFFSDVLFIFLAYIGASNIYTEDSKVYIGVVGGIILMIFGAVSFFKKPDILRRRSPKYRTPKTPSPVSIFIKGFLLNLANPFIFFFWFASMSMVTAHTDPENLQKYVITFFGSALLTVFSSDLLKCYIGHKFKKILRPRVTLWINRGIGVMLFIFGIVLIYRVFYPF